MEVILLSDVEKVGLRGEVVDVARGYARNFLLPRRLAEVATPAKVAEVRKREQLRARHEAKSVDQAQAIADTLRKTVLRFDVTAGPTGRLFGSVTPTDIADELWRTRKIRDRPAQDRHRHDQADRPLRRAGAGLPGRRRRGEDARRAGGRRAAARRGARGDGGGRARRGGAAEADAGRGLEELEAELAAEDEIGAAAEPEGPGEIEAEVDGAVPEDAFDRADADYERPPDDFQAEPDSES